MKLWIDECLSPTLVKRANRRGYWATCNRDRDLLGASDAVLHEIVIGEEAVFVTNNESDFVALCQEVDLHTGLLILPQTDRREPKGGIIDRKLQQSVGSGDRRRQVRHSAWECRFAGAIPLALGVPHTREVAGSNPAAPIGPSPLPVGWKITEVLVELLGGHASGADPLRPRVN